MVPHLLIASEDLHADNNRTMEASFLGAKSESFTIDTTPLGGSGLTIGAGMTLIGNGGWRGSLRYIRVDRGEAEDSMVSAGIRYRF